MYKNLIGKKQFSIRNIRKYDDMIFLNTNRLVRRFECPFCKKSHNENSTENHIVILYVKQSDIVKIFCRKNQFEKYIINKVLYDEPLNPTSILQKENIDKYIPAMQNKIDNFRSVCE